MEPNQRSLTISDHGCDITITCEDILKYHGPYMNAGVAVAFQWLRLVFQETFIQETPDRDDLYIITGQTGLGVLDTIEYVTRAKTRNRLIIDPEIELGQYNPYNRGGFFFQLQHRDGRKRSHVLKDDLIPVEFFKMWSDLRRGVKDEELPNRLFTMRDHLKDRLLSSDPDTLFDPVESVGGALPVGASDTLL